VGKRRQAVRAGWTVRGEGAGEAEGSDLGSRCASAGREGYVNLTKSGLYLSCIIFCTLSLFEKEGQETHGMFCALYKIKLMESMLWCAGVLWLSKSISTAVYEASDLNMIIDMEMPCMRRERKESRFKDMRCRKGLGRHARDRKIHTTLLCVCLFFLAPIDISKKSKANQLMYSLSAPTRKTGLSPYMNVMPRHSMGRLESNFVAKDGCCLARRSIYISSFLPISIPSIPPSSIDSDQNSRRAAACLFPVRTPPSHD
jgi:hypothetical protein